jgi:hypothetical protein
MSVTFIFNGQSTSHTFTSSTNLEDVKAAIHEEHREDWFGGVDLDRIVLKDCDNKNYSLDKVGQGAEHLS